MKGNFFFENKSKEAWDVTFEFKKSSIEAWQAPPYLQNYFDTLDNAATATDFSQSITFSAPIDKTTLDNVDYNLGYTIILEYTDPEGNKQLKEYLGYIKEIDKENGTILFECYEKQEDN